MTLRTIASDGPWTLVGTIDTTPEWVGWVHRDAARWRDVVLELVAEGRRLGVEEPGGGAEKWALRYRQTVALTRALGQLARALDLPIQCFAPWAWMLFWKLDVGELPWPGWEFANGGQWRVRVLEAARSVEAHVRDAASVRIVLDYRVGLSGDGELVTPVPETFGARQTPEGEDWNGRVCSADSPTPPTWWDCIPMSVWWPGALHAAPDVYLRATVPLKWHWQHAAAAADAIAELGDIEQLVAVCRRYVAVKNLKAVAYMHTLQEVDGREVVQVDVPEDLLLVAASDQLQNLRSVRVAGVDLANVFSRVGQLALQAPPVGTIIGAILMGLAEVLRAFGSAVGVWYDVWGRREPVLEIPRLSGTLSTTLPQAPTHSVAAPPPPPDVEILEVTDPGSVTARQPGESLAAWRRRARSILARQRDESLRGVTTSAEASAVVEEGRRARGGSGSSSGGAALALAALVAVAALSGPKAKGSKR